MRDAVALAARSVAEGGGPFGAVIVRGGVVVGRGRNRVVESGDPTAHAEVEAIRDACRRLGSHRLDGCEVYASCEPCPMCFGAIYWARPAAVFFAAGHAAAAAAGFDDAHIGEEFRVPPGQRRIPFARLEMPEADEPFRLWAAKPDRREY
ncbi:MAG: nucleoside deaminase [Gemmatimonadota bacterium]|nr:nucleoside deaminase [Gemmatimonadota bacterium]